MINLYSGTPGSGKSCHAAKLIADRLHRAGSITIGNFYVNTKAVKNCKGIYLYVPNHRLDPERFILFSRRLARHLGRRLREGEVVVLLDEAQLLFNSRDWQTSRRQSWLSFFSQHRHFGFDFILLAQFDRMLDRQIRGLIEYDFIHRKIKNAGRFGAFLGFLSAGNMFVCVKKWYPISEVVETNFFFGSKSVYDIYDSYNYFESVDEKPTKNPVAAGRRTSGA